MKKLIMDKQSLLVIAIATAALATVYILGGLAYITLSSTSTTATQDLSTASAWIGLCAIVGYLINAANLSFNAMIKKDWKVTGELAGMTIAFFVIAIGLLVAALNINLILVDSTTAAVGIGLVSLVLLYKAADLSIEAQQNGHSSQEAKLWLLSFLGVLLLSIGYGVYSPFSSTSSIVAGGVLSFIGFSLITGVVFSAYKTGKFSSVITLYVVRGTGILAISSLVEAIAQGIESSSSGTVTGSRIAGALPNFLFAIGFGVLAYSAWSLLASKQSTGAQYNYTPELPMMPEE